MLRNGCYPNPGFELRRRAQRSQLANGAEPRPCGCGGVWSFHGKQEAAFFSDEHDDTSVNSTVPDPNADIDDDAGIESFEDGENYELEDGGDEGDDDGSATVH